MVTTRRHTSAPVREAVSCGNGSAPCVRIEDYLDPYVRALALKMDDTSKAVQSLCSKMDVWLKEEESPERRNPRRVCDSQEHVVQDATPCGEVPPRSRSHSGQQVAKDPHENNGGGAADLRQSPLTMEIQTRLLHPKFKMPNLDVYDRSAVLMDHLDYFSEYLNLQDLDEMTICQCFSLTLKGDARM
ncbi:hypothetical protein Nepgr_013018 [Nepenthes gracilis]|uniref:Uncharacterized protein n=1 Tax=Nepenthes gracilis TaxID=150966 RepID=A0AAD3SIB2_NEPGR|nr:hypothetical protein Nepgr_013018 [Nepenthes gracilis]